MINPHGQEYFADAVFVDALSLAQRLAVCVL
jgi:hypothetical protein